MGTRQKVKIITIAAVGVFLGCCCSFASPENATNAPCAVQPETVKLTIDEAIILALRDNRDILLSQEAVKKAKAKIGEAKAGLLPSLSVIGGWTRTNGLYAKDYSQSTVQLGAKQYLYRGGKTSNSIKKEEYTAEALSEQMNAVRFEIVLGVKKAFYTLFFIDHLQRLNNLIMENTAEHLAVNKERFNSGLASESDILKAEAAKARAEEAYVSSLNQLLAVQALLRNLIFVDENIVIEPQGALNYEAVDIIYDQAFLKALKERPEIRQYEAQLKADSFAVEAAKADTRPSIYASFDAFGRTHLLASTAKNQNDYNTVGITFSWPVFDGFLTKRKVDQALIDLQQTRLLKDKALKDIALELKEAYVGLKDALSRLEAQKSDLKVYQDNLAVVSKQYEEGIASALDLNDAKLKYAIAEFNDTESIYGYLIAKAIFEKATGGL